MNIFALQQFFCEGEEPIRHIFEGQVHKTGGNHYAPPVGKGVETEAAVITAHTGIAYSTERKVSVHNVHYRVVDASPSG